MRIEALGGRDVITDEVPAKSVECNDGKNPTTVTSSALVL
jgi:hypothetical protein